MLTQSPNFGYVPEFDDFLALFPHRYDFIYSERIPKPVWKTESRFPLSDRLIRQGSYLYGVRFGPRTNYLLIDIDRSSAYHPCADKTAWKRIISALEPIGLTNWLPLASSYSKGLHLYLPFEDALPSYKLAEAVMALLESQGFMLSGGQLEIFPNLKAWGSPEQSRFNAHRLPLQEPGSRILMRDLSDVAYTADTAFVDRWKREAARNSPSELLLNYAIQKHKRHLRQRITFTAGKFLSDLDADINPGWTGRGQTNFILGRIALRTYIFHHQLEGGQPLRGDPLVQTICDTARSLPGFEIFCQHKPELEKRARDWARSVERSKYFAYGERPAEAIKTAENAWNKRKQEASRLRISQAVEELMRDGKFPTLVSARARALVQLLNCSMRTLYLNRELWHPAHYPQEVITGYSESTEPAPGNSLPSPPPNKLFTEADGNPAPSLGLPVCPVQEARGGAGGISTGGDASPPSAPLPSVSAAIRRQLEQNQQARMYRRWLASGDESQQEVARQWLAAHQLE